MTCNYKFNNYLVDCSDQVKTKVSVDLGDGPEPWLQVCKNHEDANVFTSLDKAVKASVSIFIYQEEDSLNYKTYIPLLYRSAPVSGTTILETYDKAAEKIVYELNRQIRVYGYIKWDTRYDPRLYSISTIMSACILIEDGEVRLV